MRRRLKKGKAGRRSGMRGIFQTGVNVPLAMALIFLLTFSCLSAPARLTYWLYPLAREVVYLKINYSTRNMLLKETEHFIIKYHPADAQAVDMVALAAEAAYEPVGKIVNYTPSKKPLIIIYKDRASMKKAYGWSGENSAMGFYWGGVIQILSPLAWLNDAASASEFVKKGPMAHEYTHLALDYLLRGNYPRWFTEGVAQYVEYSVNGYEWITKNNSLKENSYSMEELDKRFDELPNQAMAYRQSLAIMRYIIETHGKESFSKMLIDMKNGAKTDKALKGAIGLDYRELEKRVRYWAEKYMQHKDVS
jgi:hypothetical protein